MLENTLWHKASLLQIQTAAHISGNFDIGFDAEIPEETRVELRAFVNWVEDRFCLPVTLWVEFKYKHYLITREKKRAGYLFYWSDFHNYPVFETQDDLPVIYLPVRTEHSTMEEILASFIEGISCYYAWLSNTITPAFTPDQAEVDKILQAYLLCRGK